MTPRNIMHLPWDGCIYNVYIIGPTFDIINAREHGRHPAGIKGTLVNYRTALD